MLSQPQPQLSFSSSRSIVGVRAQPRPSSSSSHSTVYVRAQQERLQARQGQQRQQYSITLRNPSCSCDGGTLYLDTSNNVIQWGCECNGNSCSWQIRDLVGCLCDDYNLSLHDGIIYYRGCVCNGYAMGNHGTLRCIQFRLGPRQS